MMKSMRVAAKIAILVTPLMAQSASAQSATTGRDYSSFVLKVPYAFDLPAKFKTAWIDCSISDAARPSIYVSVAPYVDLITASSGEIIVGFDDGGGTRFSDGGHFDPHSVITMREMLSSELFELKATCGILSLLSTDNQQYGIAQFDGGRWGAALGNDTNTRPTVWMTNDYKPQVSRTFNQSENEALGAFNSGAIPNATSEQTTVTQPVQEGASDLSTLDRLLRP